jgi:hypothetical protein
MRDIQQGSRTKPSGISARRWLVLTATAAMVFFAGRMSAGFRATHPPSPSGRSADSDDTKPEPSEHMPKGRSIRAALAIPDFVPDPADSSRAPPPSPKDVHASAKFFLSRLFKRSQILPQNQPLEVRANFNREYTIGAIEAVRDLHPEDIGAMSEELNNKLCDETIDEEKTVSLAIMAFEMPELSSPRGFQCFFSRARKKEDVVLWYMLDAFNNSGQDKPAALLELAKTAKDPRTMERLMSPEDRERLHRQAVGAVSPGG